MRRSGSVKFQSSVQLFKFCQKVLTDITGGKINDQAVGAILNFNPSDCSHWKRGEKNIKSIFSLEKLAKELGLEISLIHDLTSGAINVDEAYFEFSEASHYRKLSHQASAYGKEEYIATRKKISEFTNSLLKQINFTTPPLYLPEILRYFPYISLQPVEILDKLSRILRVKKGAYLIQFKKGELKPQTRMSIVKDVAKIIFEGERERYPELGAKNDKLTHVEKLLFTADLLAPKHLLINEISKNDSRKNIIAEQATMFWVPKSLISFQLQEILLHGERPAVPIKAEVVSRPFDQIAAHM
jgi:hypothetical protein